MRLQFKSNYQGVSDYSVIGSFRSAIRIRVDHKSGSIKFDDYYKELNVSQRKGIFKTYLNDQRKNRKELLVRSKSRDLPLDREITVDCFVSSIRHSQRIYRNNTNLH